MNQLPVAGIDMGKHFSEMAVLSSSTYDHTIVTALAFVSTTGGEDAKTEKMTYTRTMMAPSRHTAA